MSSPITHSHSPTIHPLAHIQGSCAFISVVAPFLQFIPTPSCNGIPSLSRCISPQSAERGPKEHRNPANGRIKYNHLHTHQGSPLDPISRALPRSLHSHPSVAPRPPSIQPNLGLPRTRPPFTSAIITLLANRLSSIFSKCPNHLNTL